MKHRQLKGDEMNRLTAERFRESEKHPIYILLQNIRSMWNVGSIFRTADAARLEEIIITGYTATPPRKEIEKTALHATEHVTWRYIENPLIAIEELKAKGITIAALEITEESQSFEDIPLSMFPICLIVGNEVSGIDEEVLALCDVSFEIPQYGVKHSLNVAVATGIAVFELTKIYRKAMKRQGHPM